MNESQPKQRKLFSKFNFKIFGSLVAILILVAIISLNIITVDKVIIEPGTAEEVDSAISYSDVKTYDAEGEIRFLTVFVSAKKPSLAAYLKAKYLDKDDVEIYSWKDVNGNQSIAQSEELNQALMTASQNAATVVALNELGCDVGESGTGAIVSAIQKGSPASEEFKVGDVIVEIDNKEIQLSKQAAEAITAHKPGDLIDVEIERGSNKEKKNIQAKLTDSKYKEGAAFLGVGLITRDQEFKFPLNVKIDPGSVSGPSAGLAFTLSIIDQLTPGDLTGGMDVSVTGEITLDGDVNQVGGIKGKSLTARRAGSKVMIVPKGEAKQARENAGDMKVYEVSDISQALKVLEQIGGDPLRQMHECPGS